MSKANVCLPGKRAEPNNGTDAHVHEMPDRVGGAASSIPSSPCVAARAHGNIMRKG